MADVAVPVNVGSEGVTSPKAKKSPKKAAAGKKVAAKPAHPGTKLMVMAAVTSLNERNGTSLSAIKKYISANYKVDAERVAPFVRKAVKTCLASGLLVQAKGSGASGSVRLPSTDKPEKKTAGRKGKKVVKPAKPTPKKMTKSPKKAVVAAGVKKTVKAKTPVKAKLTPKSPAKKTTKRAPTKKPKSPVPKKSPGRPKAAKKAVKK